jgi:hypothetical protein
MNNTALQNVKVTVQPQKQGMVTVKPSQVQANAVQATGRK